MDKLRVAVYTRVSTKKNEQQSSFSSQQSYYANYCFEQGYELVKIYADEGLTGTNNKRKEFLEMMTDAGLSYTFGSSNKIINFDRSPNKPLFNLIIVKDVSRFARNVDVTRAAELLAEKGVHILFENNNLKTDKEGWQFELGLYLTFANREAVDRSNKIKWSRKHKTAQNKYHYSRVPFGYKYDQNKSEYVLNPREARFVKRIFAMYCYEGKGCRLIAQWLTENAILNRTAKNTAAKWNESTVSRMLENQVYIGNVVVGKVENNISGTGIRKKISKEKWVVLENAIPAIISKELFEAAQEIRKQRRQVLNDNTVKGTKLSEDKFYRKIKCGNCSSDFVRVSGTKVNKEGIKRTEVTYYCKNRRKYGTCKMRGVSYNVLAREIINAASLKREGYLKYTSSRETELKRANDLLSILDDKEKNANEEKKKVEKKLAKLEKERNKITIAFVQANRTMAEALNEQMDLIIGQKQKLLEELAHFDLVEIEKERQRIHDRYNRLIESKTRSIESVSEAIDSLSHLTVNENKKLVFHFKTDTLLFAIINVMQLDDFVAQKWSIDDESTIKPVTSSIEVNY